MSYYNTINKAYVRQKKYIYMYDNYNGSIKTYELLLKIISYNDNDDTKFDIFYEKHMANFKLTQHYDIYHIHKEPFNSFINSEDFITTIGKIIWWFFYKNFCKEIHAFLTDIIKIIENEEELKNKLNASIVANDIIDNIFIEVIKDIPEKQEENTKIKEYEQICKILKTRGFNNTLICMQKKAQDIKNTLVVANNIREKPHKEPIKIKKKPISATMKRLVWNTHIGEEIGKTKCLCCNVTAITQLSFNCGHIIAEVNGGDTIVSNLKPICQNCNSSMATKNMDDFMKTLK
jgi:hypothetical protein